MIKSLLNLRPIRSSTWLPLRKMFSSIAQAPPRIRSAFAKLTARAHVREDSPQTAIAVAEPLWVNPGFSTRELHGSRICIEWLRDGRTLEERVYRLDARSYGHSRHILNIRAIRLGESGCSIASMEFDQADVERMHRSNEAPKLYKFVARLEWGRPREQNEELAKFVRERRLRKMQDTSGSDDWELSIAPVLHPAPIHFEHCQLPEHLDQEGSGRSGKSVENARV